MKCNLLGHFAVSITNENANILKSLRKLTNYLIIFESRFAIIVLSAEQSGRRFKYEAQQTNYGLCYPAEIL
jgi:hypothetical protein